MMLPLVPIALAFLAGILLAWFRPAVPGFLLGVALVASGMSVVWCRRELRGFIPLLLLWLCVGALRTTTWQHQPANHVARLVTKEPAPVRVHGVVVDDPVELFAPGEPERQVAVIEARSARIGKAWKPVTGLIRARLREFPLKLVYGDEVLVEGKWSEVPAPGNPGQYDWKAALTRQRIHALLSVEPYHGVVRLAAGQGRWWFQAIYALRHRLERLIDLNFSPYHAGLLRSLLLGQRVALDEDLKQAFIKTGTMHLLVISGFNVGLLAGLLEVGLRLFGIPWRLRLIASAGVLGGYCMLVGMQPPVVRATIMAWIVLGAFWLDRLINWSNVLAAAALVILWVNPSQLFDPGFQLSFGAVLSLLVFAPRGKTLLERRLGWFKPGWLRAYLAISLSSTLAIWVGLSPLIAWYFHLVSPISMVANLLVLPPVSGLVAVGTVALALVGGVPLLMRGAAACLVMLLKMTVALVTWCQAVPLGWWQVGHPSWLLVGGFYGLVSLTVLRRRIRLNHAQCLGIWLLAIGLWSWGAVARHLAESHWLELTMLDVGHGDSLILRTPSRHTIVVDGGSHQEGRFAVVPFLRHRGWQTVDALIVTHMDEDHLGGAIPLLEQLRVRRLLTNGAWDETLIFHEVITAAHRKGLAPERLTSGMRLNGVAGVAIEVLHPPPGYVPDTDPAGNENSVMLRVTKGAVSFLLTGDIDEEGLRWYLNTRHYLPAVDVLKVPHHGSDLGNPGEAFFGNLRPSVALISVGRAHGLPSPDTLQALDRVGARRYLTPRDGAITLRTDGKRLLVKTYWNAPRE